MRVLGIPTYLDGLKVTLHVDQKPATKLDAGLCHYIIHASGSDHFLIASPTITVHEDDLHHHENSALLPDFDFRSLVDLNR